MNMFQPVNPIDPARLLGGVCAVFPGRANAILSDSASPSGQSLYGRQLGTGQVGEFVVVDVEQIVVLGRVTAVRLPERDRKQVEPELGKNIAVSPIAEIQLLASYNRESCEVIAGVPQHPRLGARVYSISPAFLGELVKRSGATGRAAAIQPKLLLSLGHVADLHETLVDATPERLFGRHCAVLGATGGGKSFTVARLVEESCRYQCKVIVLDPTGEFVGLKDDAVHIILGAESGEEAGFVPFEGLEEQDLYALFTPSGRAQGPRFREAIQSLRLAELAKSDAEIREKLTEAGILDNGLIIKEQKNQKIFERIRAQHISQIERPDAPLDVSLLARQVIEECVWPPSYKNPETWGGRDDSAVSFCLPLVSRIHGITRAPELRVVFRGTGKNLFEVIDEFITSSKRLLRVSLETVPHAFAAREVIANSIGRRLMRAARGKRFRNSCPVVVFLDEAHHFLNRRVGDDDASVYLDAFEQIAKEGRKYWLTLCMATQRPRDLPEGVLSQMGTMIVHRLINDRDREIVERACGEIDRSAAAFLPTLSPGEAAIVGVDFPFPLAVQMNKPIHEPESKGPDFQTKWSPPELAPSSPK